MTDQEMQIAIAEACGISVCPNCLWEIDPETCHCGDSVKSHGMSSGHNPVPMGCTCGYDDADQRRGKHPECPDYPNDLNAMHEAEKTLCHDNNRIPQEDGEQSDWDAYIGFLEDIVSRDCAEEEIYRLTISATARQRAEAFLRTVGKWRDA